ncbi:MAG: magnesium/cobalt transporter CorA, partial [Candidatus Marinimicrobia bacterium]|nr:magnesium/cobalt transporter CorA [Candidatus Neomarinimicrobiota bacterium]
VRKRMENEKSRLRNSGTDYLAYALIDAIVDHYFIVLDELGERIIGIEESLMNDPGEEILEEIHGLKREMISLRGAIWPMREVIAQIHRGESELFTEKTLLFLRDVYDHTIQVVDTVESYRDLLSGLMDLYLSTLSNRMNEVMKVLTIIATIFIPLTFIAGIYGMNFENMPELGIPWAYPAVWAVMIGVVIVMLIYFRKKKWL